VVDELLTGGPEDDEIPFSRDICQGHNAEEQKGESKRQSSDACNRYIRYVSLFLGRWNI
jgi:hypothetical protein